MTEFYFYDHEHIMDGFFEGLGCTLLNIESFPTDHHESLPKEHTVLFMHRELDYEEYDKYLRMLNENNPNLEILLFSSQPDNIELPKKSTA